MFFADPPAAFRNLHNALRPGGRLCMAVWATVGESLQQSIPIEVAIRHLGPPESESSRAPGPNAYGDRDYLRSVLGGAGYTSIAIEPRPFLVHGDDAASAAEHASQMGAVQRLIDEKHANAATQAGIVRDITTAFAAHETPDGLRLPATFLRVTARKGG
jgi:hypothetical protein